MGKRVHRIGLKQMAKRTLNIGYRGENIHTKVVIDCSDLLQDYPDAEIEMRAIMPGSADIHKPAITVSDGCVTWEFTQEELTHNGAGRMQLTFTDDGEVIKSDVGNFFVQASL